MTITHATSSTPRFQALPHRAGADTALAIAVALFLAVLIVEAMIIATNPPSTADLGSFYSITT
jgi:hypothetical protein